MKFHNHFHLIIINTTLKWARNQGISNPGLFQTWKKFRFGQTNYFPRFVTAVWNSGLKPDIFPGLKSRFSTIWNWVWTWKNGRFTNPDLNLGKCQVWTWLLFAILKLVVSNPEKSRFNLERQHLKFTLNRQVTYWLRRGWQQIWPGWL